MSSWVSNAFHWGFCILGVLWCVIVIKSCIILVSSCVFFFLVYIWAVVVCSGIPKLVFYELGDCTMYVFSLVWNAQLTWQTGSMVGLDFFIFIFLIFLIPVCAGTHQHVWNCLQVAPWWCFCTLCTVLFCFYFLFCPLAVNWTSNGSFIRQAVPVQIAFHSLCQWTVNTPPNSLHMWFGHACG